MSWREFTFVEGNSRKFWNIELSENAVTVHGEDNAKGLAPKTVSLKPGAVTESVVVDLAPLGALEGTVLGEDNKPLGGASVSVAGAADPSRGQMKRPWFKRRAAHHTPKPSCTSSLMRVPRALANRYPWWDLAAPKT